MVHVVQRVAHAALQGVLDGGHRLPLRPPTVQTGAQADPRQAPPGCAHGHGCPLPPFHERNVPRGLASDYPFDVRSLWIAFLTCDRRFRGSVTTDDSGRPSCTTGGSR